jgi:hypothetical protein
VVDPDWDDHAGPDDGRARTELAAVIGDWIAGARTTASTPEIDNLDTFTCSHGLITETTPSPVRLSADAAHAVGLPIAQKNSAEITGRRAEMGTDFAVAEECNRWHEVMPTRAYGDHVLVIEHRRRDFDALPPTRTCRSSCGPRPARPATRATSTTAVDPIGLAAVVRWAVTKPTFILPMLATLVAAPVRRPRLAVRGRGWFRGGRGRRREGLAPDARRAGRVALFRRSSIRPPGSTPATRSWTAR